MSLKIHNFLICYPILLIPFLIGESDFSASIESKLFLDLGFKKYLTHFVNVLINM